MTVNSTPNGGINPDSADLDSSLHSRGALEESEIFLEKLLGIRLHSFRNNEVGNAPGALADRITQRVLDVVGETRSGVSAQNLRNALNARLNQALTEVQNHRPGTETLTSNIQVQRTAAIAQAVREVIPENVLLDFVRTALPAVEMVNNQGVEQNHVRFPCNINDIPCTVDIDMMHTFWRETQYQDATSLQNALKEKRLGEVGITVLGNGSVGHLYTLQDADAVSLVSATINTLDTAHLVPTVRVPLVTSAGQNVVAVVDVPRLVRATDAANTKVATMNVNALQTYLRNSNALERFVTYEGLPDTSRINVGSFNNAQLSILAAEIFDSIHQPAHRAAGNSLLTRRQSLFEIQANVSTQHRNFTRLREGSSNPVAAAMAASLMMQHRDLQDVFSSRSEPEVQTEMNEVIGKNALIDSLNAISNQVMPTNRDNWQQLETKIKDVHSNIGSLTSGTSVIVGSGATKEEFKVGSSLRDVEQVRNVLATKLSEYQSDAQKYKVIDRMLRSIVRDIQSLGLTIPAQLLNFYHVTPTAVTLKKNAFTPDVDLSDLVQKIKLSLDLKNQTEYAEDISNLKKELKSVKEGSGGIHGDAAQHRVFTEYLMRYKNMTQHEAARTANYMRARSLLDADLMETARDVTETLYGKTAEQPILDRVTNLANLSVSPTRRSMRIVQQIARFAGVPTQGAFHPFAPTPGIAPKWSSADYNSLMIAYFAMKDLYNGKGHDRIKLQQTAFVQQQMQEVTKALLQKHSHAFMQHVGAQVNATGDQADVVQTDVNPSEHKRALFELLSGPTPQEYKKPVTTAIKKAEQNVDWWRRNLLTSEKHGMLYGKNNWVSARNLLYGNEYLSAAGLYWRLPKKALSKGAELASDATRAAWKRKGAIATGALIGTLFMPGIGTAIGASIGAARKPTR